MRTAEEIAIELLKCAIAHEPDVRLVGNVTAAELGRVVAYQVQTCPKCGATAWVNIDCDLCLIATHLENGETP
jgi:hypothetical protein